MPTKPFDLELEWLEFASYTFKSKISQIQYDEMKKAFYAGSITSFLFCMRDLPDYPEIEAMRILDHIGKQIADYGDELQNEKN